MGKYLKKFETQSAYEAAQSSLILPNVSLTVDNNTVHYNPNSPTPPTPSHDYVEIAGIKWATMNIGATGITDGGLYFQWGDTSGYTADQVTGSSTPHKEFDESDYKYYNNGSYTKYNETDELVTLQPSDDAVTAAWGGNWRMPTIEELATLTGATTSVWTNDYQGSGVAGIVLTDKTDASKTLFFPNAGSFYGDEFYNDNTYWSSSSEIDNGGYYGWSIYFDGYEQWWSGKTSSRFEGNTVRGVLDE